MRRHNGLGINLLYDRHERLLLGDRRVGLTPRGHLNYLGQGVKYPSACPCSSDRDPDVPASDIHDEKFNEVTDLENVMVLRKGRKIHHKKKSMKKEKIFPQT
jgi:hypothetical protein